MEDFINTSFNELLDTLGNSLPISEQNVVGIDPFGPLGLAPPPPEIYGEGDPEPLDTAVNPNA